MKFDMFFKKHKELAIQFLKISKYVVVRLNLINHLVGFIPCQICLYFSN